MDFTLLVAPRVVVQIACLFSQISSRSTHRSRSGLLFYMDEYHSGFDGSFCYMDNTEELRFQHSKKVRCVMLLGIGGVVDYIGLYGYKQQLWWMKLSGRKKEKS